MELFPKKELKVTAMKTNKEDKKDERKPDQTDRTKQDHGVETPTPPQVMDPSAHPEDSERKGTKKQEKDKARSTDNAPDKKKKSGGEKLAPAEEL